MTYNFKSSEIENQIPHLVEKGITEFTVSDEKISRDKNRILKIFNLMSQYAPEVFISIVVDVNLIDKDVINAAGSLFSCLEIPLVAIEKGGKLLFDKKLYAKKARLLNDYGLVFGFLLTYADSPADSLKLFLDRLDFATNQYPNHIDFPQTENVELEQTAKVSGAFSAKDIRYARDVSFGCRTFYSAGRAVTWMLSVLRPLKIHPSKFFADFAEWQHCNNCDFKSGYVPEKENHEDIEKMQLLFLDEKYEEKSCKDLIPLVHDIVIINGAISRVAGEGKESVIDVSYHPEDLLGPESFDLLSFAENVCMMNCRVKIFETADGPDFEILN
ncbi:MAG: hypothetical protein SPE59_11450 [Treponema sp.]|nr:hypothetical protein [Treponema sp.]